VIDSSDEDNMEKKLKVKTMTNEASAKELEWLIRVTKRRPQAAAQPLHPDEASVFSILVLKRHCKAGKNKEW